MSKPRCRVRVSVEIVLPCAGECAAGTYTTYGQGRVYDAAVDVRRKLGRYRVTLVLLNGQLRPGGGATPGHRVRRRRISATATDARLETRRNSNLDLPQDSDCPPAVPTWHYYRTCPLPGHMKHQCRIDERNKRYVQTNRTPASYDLIKARNRRTLAGSRYAFVRGCRRCIRLHVPKDAARHDISPLLVRPRSATDHQLRVSSVASPADGHR